ncbi:ALP1-like protein isoform X1 [Tanacetum coccineum]
MELYGEEYLRKPTQTNIDKLYAYHGEKHEFSGLVGSIECTKWPWAQCPVGLLGQFWLNNDIHVIRQSPILNNLKEGIPTELLPIIAEKVHQEKVRQEKLKAVKSRLNFEEASQHSESGTPSSKRDLKEWLGSRHVRSSPEALSQGATTLSHQGKKV